jgi:hypothetical protein
MQKQTLYKTKKSQVSFHDPQGVWIWKHFSVDDIPNKQYPKQTANRKPQKCRFIASKKPNDKAHQTQGGGND